jgi:Glyoxalase-like domain
MTLSNDDSDVSSSLFEDDGHSDEDEEENNRSAAILERLVNREQNGDQDDVSTDGEEDLLAMGDEDKYEEADEDEDEEDEEEEEEEDEFEEEEVDDEVDDEVEDDEAEDAAVVIPIAVSTVAKDGDNDDEDNDDDDGYDSDEVQDTLKKKPKKVKKPIQLAPISSVTADDDEEDIAMKALLTEWGVDKEDVPQDNEEAADDDDSSNASERIVQLEDGLIDHIVLAAPDLEEAMAQFEEMAGVGAKIFGAINGIGIRCARISFNDASYLEIIAPDPKQPGPIGQLIKAKGIKDMTPFAFAIRSSRTEELKDEVTEFKYVPDHITMFGGKKDGTARKWEMLHLYGHELGGICPYFVNWDTTDHPCATLPVVGKLKKFTIRAPSDDPIHKLLAHVGVRDLNIEVGTPKMSFQFSSPEGTIKFATSKAVGYKFPGFDDEEHGLDGTAGASKDDDEGVFSSPESPELLQIECGEYETLPAPAY